MKKILLIKRGAMGDILMTTPLIRQLYFKIPQVKIDYCLASPFLSALKDNPYLRNIITLEDNVFTSKGIFRFIKFILSVRQQYDYIFILGKNWQVNLLSLLFKGKTIGYARENISKYLLTKSVKYDDVLRYHGLYYLDLLGASGLANPDYTDIQLDIEVSAADRQIVEDKLSKLNLDDFVVVVNSGGNNQFETGGARMLPEAKIISLLKTITAKGYKVILLGGGVDKLNYDRYQSNFPGDIVNVAGVFNLPQSIFLISKSRHFYTTDCGAMHLGVIANIGSRMTCFFGPTCPKHVLPPNNKFNVYWEDQDIFDKDYPLRGTIQPGESKFFKKLDINKLSTEYELL